MMRRKFVAGVLAMLWLMLTSCAQVLSIPRTEIQITEENGFKTFKFAILGSEFRPRSEGGEVLGVWFGGLWNGREAAMRLSLDLEWEAPKQEPPVFPVWLGLVGFVAESPRGAAFVQEFAKALGERSQDLSGVEDLVLETVTLGEKPGKQDREFWMKAFKKSESAEGYAEFYLRIDLDRGVVVISEKDLDYRKALATVFVEQGPR